MSEPVLDRFDQQSGLLVDTVILPLVSTAFCQSEFRWRTAVIVSVRIVKRQGRPSLSGNGLIETAGQAWRAFLILTAETHAVIEAEPLGKLWVDFCCNIISFESFFPDVHQTALIQIIERCVVIEFLATAVSTEIVFLWERPVFVNDIETIHIINTDLITVSPYGFVPWCRAECIKDSSILGNTLSRFVRFGIVVFNNFRHAFVVEEYPTAAVGVGIVQETGEVNRVHHVVFVDRISPAEWVVVVKGQFAVVITLLGCDQDDTERCAWTVNRRCRCIL